jgi:U1 small nuclear ribonucleoprotein
VKFNLKAFKTNEETLEKEFKRYGDIKAVKIVRDLENKSKGYGFIEFVHKRDFMSGYKQGCYKMIDGRRVMVDAELARTNKNFRPMRLGGGKGQSRKSRNHPYKK